MENFTNSHTPALDALKNYYGFESFRPPQEDIITDLISGQDLLILMPTGGGKSLCYQIPSIVRPGIGIVVSPLIALMEDQVAALKLLGIRADYYNSSLTSQEARTVLQKLHHDELDLLYIAPERLLSQSFLEHLHECRIALFAIDEAHCISQWGHDFRPEYGALGILKTKFPKVPIIALTATADKQTRKDIVEKLNYNPKEYIASFNRPNIYYQVLAKENPLRQLKQFLDSKANCPGIIYCGTRLGVERLTEKLRESGYNARAYHAGLSHQERREVQTMFRHDKVDLIVATIAFGMGIDKPNVRFVVHYDLPKTIESYYQETGRAGRDGLPANALLLYDPADSTRIRSLISANTPKSHQQHEHAKLNLMLAYADASTCRRQILLQYFNEMMDMPCGYCDVCDSPPETVDATVDAQKVLSCIFRMQQNYGLSHLINVLRGKMTEKITQAGHHRLSTFGIGKDKSQNYWKYLTWQLILREYCYQDFDHFQVLRLHMNAKPVLRGDEKIFINLPRMPLHNESKKKNMLPKVQNCAHPLFERLRELRKQLAEEEDKPPFMIFSDVTLHDMIRVKPRTLTDLLSVFGVGQHKLNLYGKQFLKIIQQE
ncbi:DNA helicase RecQ [Legionella londiniensis]|uniref:DNA helicase RecQ n=1 Tax=Legionella londiniensis TaxID=45068 RepID=A0A0W0VM27_9GAMM|nr:DNA helicase RecQ [Legionella londiniensis]KTD21205.1 ATP-dependent DNA helicase RecQ [Legionella londiniensis]STX93230.1 Superfamily II DNA helicase [Legionella londiniensis]